MNPKLNGIAEIRTFFRTNTQPIYCFEPDRVQPARASTRWVRNFQYVVYYDSCDRPRAAARRTARSEGYRGFLEIDVLVDLATDEVYLGELNPRISGASSMTNVTAGAYADVPLFLFHLLEFMDADYVVDVAEINERWRDLAAVDVWAQLIMKEPADQVERILAGTADRDLAPRRGRPARVRWGRQ